MTRIARVRPPEEVEERATLRDTVLTATPSQIDAWVNNTATDAAGIRQVLRRLAKITVLTARATIKSQ